MEFLVILMQMPPLDMYVDVDVSSTLLSSLRQKASWTLFEGWCISTTFCISSAFAFGVKREVSTGPECLINFSAFYFLAQWSLKVVPFSRRKWNVGVFHLQRTLSMSHLSTALTPVHIEQKWTKESRRARANVSSGWHRIGWNDKFQTCKNTSAKIICPLGLSNTTDYSKLCK